MVPLSASSAPSVVIMCVEFGVASSSYPSSKLRTSGSSHTSENSTALEADNLICFTHTSAARY